MVRGILAKLGHSRSERRWWRRIKGYGAIIQRSFKFPGLQLQRLAAVRMEASDRLRGWKLQDDHSQRQDGRPDASGTGP